MDFALTLALSRERERGIEDVRSKFISDQDWELFGEVVS